MLKFILILFIPILINCNRIEVYIDDEISRAGIDIWNENVKYYDVIGDTVNTAKRIEGEATSGEVLMSKAALDDLIDPDFNIGKQRYVHVKGKQEMLSLYLV